MQPPKSPIIPDPLHKTPEDLEKAAELWADWGEGGMVRVAARNVMTVPSRDR
jgi:hypothetical protein